MDYLWLNFAHILAFVYWLGGDLGTFFSSRYVIDDRLSVESRSIALKIMLACDQGPKLAMPLIFVLGLQMASDRQLIVIPEALLMTLWILSLLWAVNVLYLHLGQRRRAKAFLSKIDLLLRIVVVIGTTAVAFAGLLFEEMVSAAFISYKLIIFAMLVGFGIMVRLVLRDFMPAYEVLLNSGPNAAINDQMTRSMRLAKPWVWGIWVGLFANALIGIHLINTPNGFMALALLTSVTPFLLLLVTLQRHKEVFA